MIKEEQIEALLDDLDKAQQAGLLVSEGIQPAWPNFRIFLISKSMVAMTSYKHKVLSAYLNATYPNLSISVVTHSISNGDSYIAIDV